MVSKPARELVEQASLVRVSEPGVGQMVPSFESGADWD